MPKTEDETILPDDKDIFAAALKDEASGAEEQPKDEKPPEEKTEAEETDESEEDEPDDKAEVRTEGQKRKDYRVPAWRLREETEKRQAAEDRAAQAEQARLSREAELDRREREIEERMRRAAAANPPKPEPTPDLIDNPQAYQQHLETQFERKLTARLIDMSFDDAKETHGAKFDEAWSWLTRQIELGNAGLRDEIVRAPNPGRALMRKHGEQRALSEIGSDPEAWKTKQLETLRQQLAADPAFREELLKTMRSEASGNADQSRPNTVTRLPSLNRATGSRSNEADDNTPMNDGEVFRHVTRR